MNVRTASFERTGMAAYKGLEEFRHDGMTHHDGMMHDEEALALISPPASRVIVGMHLRVLVEIGAPVLVAACTGSAPAAGSGCDTTSHGSVGGDALGLGLGVLVVLRARRHR